MFSTLPTHSSRLVDSGTQSEPTYCDRRVTASPVAHSRRFLLQDRASDYSYQEGQTTSKLARARHFLNIWESLPGGDSDERPQHPYTDLIKLCILKRCDARLTLNELYHDLEEKFLFFASPKNGKGWKNTLRHNLSTQPYFVKLNREHGQSGKGHYWTYEPHLEKPSSLAQSSIMQHIPSLSTLLPSQHQYRLTPPKQPRHIVLSSEKVHRYADRFHYRHWLQEDQTSTAESGRELLLRREGALDASSATPISSPPSMSVRSRSHTISGAERYEPTQLYHLPSRAPRRSMGDFYLNNPISSSPAHSFSRRSTAPY